MWLALGLRSRPDLSFCDCRGTCKTLWPRRELLQVLRLGLPGVGIQSSCAASQAEVPLTGSRSVSDRGIVKERLAQTLWGSCSGWGGGGIWPWSGHCGLGWDYLTFVVLDSLESGETTWESTWEMEWGLKD